VVLGRGHCQVWSLTDIRGFAQDSASQVLRGEIRDGYLEMMKLMKEVLQPADQRPQLPLGNLSDRYQQRSEPIASRIPCQDPRNAVPNVHRWATRWRTSCSVVECLQR